MSSRRGLRSCRVLGLLLLLAVAGLVLQGASVPHTHAASSPGFYNHDHDLVLLAALHSGALLADVVPAPLVVVVVAAVTPPPIRSPASAPRPTCDCRAPPLA
jgi:hypothetical protein